ncbi:MAG TPA: SRPBCC family protein [Polyangiaceae bacterium]|nr:SRPBCC family protein [Polyangiaceae bacterium]
MTASARGRTDRAERLVKATPERIYAAFVDGAALMAWLPPRGMTGRVLELKAREGGRYRIELSYADNARESSGKTTGRTDVSSGRFVEMLPGRRIKQSVEFESSDAAFAGEMMMTWSFDAVPDGTLVTVTAENVPRGISKQDHDAGMQSSLENLARFVERPT